MAKISEVLDIQRSYSEQVELRSEYFDVDTRVDRMAHYKPIRAHRVAFEKIAEGIWKQNNKRSYVLSGSFGTGKSHLLMMAASYFSTPSTTPEMQQFFSNYEVAEQEEKVENPKATQLKNMRKEGQFLISICDYASTEFETNILRAIRETLDNQELDLDTMETAYRQAIDKIKEWQNSGNTYFIDELERILEAEGSSYSVDSLISDMEEYEVDALEKFKLLHKQITSADFQYAKDNYVEVISQLTKLEAIKKNYKGWVILFDEFDYQVGGKRFKLEQFQKFLQMCSKSLLDGFPILFIATIHKSFLDYKSVYNASDFSTISDRLDEIKLESEGIEDIISAVVNPKKDSPAWTAEVMSNQSKMVQLANETNKHHLFDWLRAAQIKGKIIENIYPMHPAATYALIKLAGAAGSNNRSVVTFFAEQREERGSYAEYINHTNIVENGELNLYTADRLSDYFTLSSASENVTDVAREYIRNYETSLRELAKIRHNDMTDIVLADPIFERVLKIMVIYDIIGLANTPELIKYGLNMVSVTQSASLDNVFKLASEKKIIYLNDTNGCYEFKRSDSKDISGLVRDYKSKPANIPENYAKALEEVCKSEFASKTKKKIKGDALSPQKYNLMYLEDKRLRRVFCVFKDLENEQYFAQIHSDLLAETDLKKKDDGAIIYVICESQDEVNRAIALTKKNMYPEIMIAVPKEPANICDDIFSLKAACYYQDNTSEFSPQDIRALKEQAQAYDTKIAKRLDYIMDSKNYQAYAAYGETLENGAYDVGAVALLERIYKGKRNTVKHDEINKSHEFKENNIALRDAIDRLLDVSQVIAFHNDYGNDRGDIKYIKNLLVQNGVVFVNNTQGALEYCVVEKDIERYRLQMPALHDMIKEIHDSEGTEIDVQKFIQKYVSSYGIGYNAVLLYMAMIKRYFADSLSFVKDVMAVGSINVNNIDVLKAVVLSQDYVNCVMKYEPISEEEAKYIERLITVFGGSGAGNLELLQQSIKKWYMGLEPICKATDLYDDSMTKKFVSACNKIDTTSIREIVLFDFKEVVGQERDTLIYGSSIIDELIQGLSRQKDIVDNGYLLIRKKIVEGISSLFGEITDDIVTVEATFRSWYKELDEAQRDVLNPLQNENSKPIAKAVGSERNFADVLLSDIPTDMKFGSVKMWTSDKSAEYIQSFKNGKTHLENDVYAVSTPEYVLSGKGVSEEKHGKDSEIRFSGDMTITIECGAGNAYYYVTTDGTNPTDPMAQRIKRMEAYAIVINRDTTVKICGVGDNNKYSSVLDLRCVNEETKYEVKVSGMQQFQKIDSNGITAVNDVKVHSIVPIDSDSLCLCVKSIAELMKTNHNVGTEEIVKGLRNAIDDLEG